jgi:hypothetical protein
VVSRYDDCWAALRDPRLGKQYPQQIEQRFGPDWRRHPSLTAGEHEHRVQSIRAMLAKGG